MTVRKIFSDEQLVEVTGAGYEPQGEFRWNGSPIEPSAALVETLRASVLASDAELVRSESGDEWQVRGDPTEAALIVAAAKAGLHRPDLLAEFPRVDEIPFTSEAKRMTTVHETPNGSVAYAKGAPEVVVQACTRQLTASGETALDEAGREALLETARQLASEALRVLAVAGRRGATIDDAGRELTFLGLVGMIDAPPAGGEGGRSDLRGGRDPAGDDHRRPSAHGRGGRARDRAARRRARGHRLRARVDGRGRAGS